MIKLSEWWMHDKQEIMSYVYWLKSQLPPLDKQRYDESWKQVKQHLIDSYGEAP